MPLLNILVFEIFISF